MNGNDSRAVAVVGVSRRAFAAFDAASFGFSPREAEALSPAHQAFLQHAREAFQDAGGEAGETWGVFAGGGGDPAGDAVQPELEAGRFHGMLGGDADYLATRVSFKLGLTGPGLTVTGGGAAPLAAVHLACESLLSGEVDAALAGGAEGAVALRRLDDALAGGRSIRAVIRRSALHHDGTLGGLDRPGLAELLRTLQSPPSRWVVTASNSGGLHASLTLEEPPRERRR